MWCSQAALWNLIGCLLISSPSISYYAGVGFLLAIGGDPLTERGKFLCHYVAAKEQLVGLENKRKKHEYYSTPFASSFVLVDKLELLPNPLFHTDFKSHQLHSPQDKLCQRTVPSK